MSWCGWTHAGTEVLLQVSQVNKTLKDAVLSWLNKKLKRCSTFMVKTAIGKCWGKVWLSRFNDNFYFSTSKWIHNINPNTIKSYKILQKLSPKHAAHGVAQSTYPNYRHGKACLSKQPPWRAAEDPRLARGRSRVRAPGPAGALRALFFSTLPSFLLPEIVFFRTFPTNPAKVLLSKFPGFIFKSKETC